MIYENTTNLTDQEFRRLTGIKRTTFARITEIRKTAEAAKSKKGGHKSKLSVEGKLLLTLEYLRESRTYFRIAGDFGIHETSVIRISRWVEDALIKDGTFSLLGRKALTRSDVSYEVVLIDATETPVERPKRGGEKWYSGKKKRHTLKTQVVVDKKTHVEPDTTMETDTGFQGIGAPA